MTIGGCVIMCLLAYAIGYIHGRQRKRARTHDMTHAAKGKERK